MYTHSCYHMTSLIFSGRGVLKSNEHTCNPLARTRNVLSTMRFFFFVFFFIGILFVLKAIKFYLKGSFKHFCSPVLEGWLHKFRNDHSCKILHIGHVKAA